MAWHRAYDRGHIFVGFGADVGVLVLLVGSKPMPNRWRIGMAVDRLVEHQSTIARAEHGPGPVIHSFFDGEAKLLVELDTRGDAFDGEHRDEAG